MQRAILTPGCEALASAENVLVAGCDAFRHSAMLHVNASRFYQIFGESVSRSDAGSVVHDSTLAHTSFSLGAASNKHLQMTHLLRASRLVGSLPRLAHLACTRVNPRSTSIRNRASMSHSWYSSRTSRLRVRNARHVLCGAEEIPTYLPNLSFSLSLSTAAASGGGLNALARIAFEKHLHDGALILWQSTMRR